MNLTKSDKIIVKILGIILLFCVIMCNVSCLGTKKATETTSTTKESELIESSKDSTKVETVNKEINDQASFKVAESKTGDDNFDKRVNDAVANILQSINMQKSSGDNSYRLWYDINEKLIKMEATIGETKDSETEVSNDTNTEKSFEESFTENTKKVVKMIPLWVWIVAGIFFWPRIWAFIKPIIKIAVSPASIGTELRKIVNDDNKV